MTNETLIQKQLQGQLSNEQMNQFNTLMETDNAFAKAYEEQHSLKKAIAANERNTLKKQLQSLEQGDQTSTSSKNPLTKWLAIAAVIAIALIGSTYFFQDLGNASKSGTELYATYYEAYPNVLQPVTRGNTPEDELSEAFLAYENGAYEDAATSFKIALDQKEDQDVRFYYAMSLLNSGDTQSALPILDTIAQSDSRFSPQSYWYIALSQLQSENKESAKDNLLQLDALDSGFKTQKIEDLLEQLEDF